MHLSTRHWRLFFLYLVMLLGLSRPTAWAATEAELSKGQLVYVPVYSHVYYGDYEHRILLTGILSIRNTDPEQTLTVVKADYYDSDGKLIKRYLSQPVTLKPMASTRIIIRESDTKGGSGANFLVEWRAETAMNEPIMEGVMIGAAGQQGISFTSRGKAIRKR